MAEVGYSTEYEVYLTRRNGIQIVTNELSLSILKEMRVRTITPTEMAVEFSVSKSTIQGNLGKLFRMGIVDSDTCVDDARSAVYHTDAMLLFSSDTPEEWQIYARKASIDRILKNGRCTPREDLSLYGVSLIESGLNIVPGLSGVGSALVGDITDLSWWGKQLANLNTQCEPEGIFSEIDLTKEFILTFRSEREDISDIPLITVPMIGAVRSRSKALLGINLCHDTQLSVEDGGHTVKLMTGAYKGQDFSTGIYDTDLSESFRADDPFSIYSVGGKAMLFTNSTMMEILDALTEDNLSLNDLERALSLPKATIYVSLAKLVDLGAICLDENSGTPKKYVLLAEPLLFTTEPKPENFSNLRKIVADFHDGKLDYYSAVITYAMEAISCMGIHFDKMFIRSGKHAATTVLQDRPDMDPQDFVDLSCSMISAPDEAKVMRYLPIKIRLTRSPDTLWGSWPEDFLVGFLKEGLKTLLKTEYPFIIDSVYEKTDSQ